jgi:hypothetical protein
MGDRMGRDEAMRTRRTILAVAATAATIGGLGLAVPAAATTAPSPTAAACDKAPWEAKVQGAPAGFGAGSPSGDYLWHNAHGFHLRVTHPRNELRVYSGVITSPAAMRMDPVRLEKGDTVKLSADRRVLVFVFANHGRIDGVDFHTDCASRLTVSRLHIGSRNLGRERVYLGVTKAHPAGVPFRVHRVRIT